MIEAMEALGFVLELRADEDDPYRLVWPDEPLRTIPIVGDRDGMGGLQFPILDVERIDPDLARELLVRLGQT